MTSTTGAVVEGQVVKQKERKKKLFGYSMDQTNQKPATYPMQKSTSCWN